MSNSQQVLSQVLGGFFPQGRWSGGQGDTLFQLFQPWEAGICGLPCLWHANHSPKQEKHFQVADIPFRTQRCSPAPVQIHRALPVRALQPVIILKATIITIETHVMGLGSRAWLIPTSIPEERKRGVPRVLLLCPAGRDRVELQGTELRVRTGQQPGPQAVWDPRSHAVGSDQAGGAAGGSPRLLTSPRPSPESHTKSLRDPFLKTCCLRSVPKYFISIPKYFLSIPKYFIFLFPCQPRTQHSVSCSYVRYQNKALFRHNPFSLSHFFYCSITPLLHFMRKGSANTCDALLEESQGKSTEMNSEELHKISLACAHHFLIYLFLSKYSFCYFSVSITLLEPHYMQFSALLSLRIGF